MSTPAPATTAKPARAKTRYHILQEVPNGQGKAYEPVAANLAASNAEAAVRDYANSQGDKLATGTILVAVPSARFKPTKITVSQTTVLKLAAA